LTEEYKEAYKGMCWLCKAKPANWREVTTCPAWERQEQSLDKAEYLHVLADREKDANPLFILPSVSNDTMMPDWMHVLDEGTDALAAGKFSRSCFPCILERMWMKGWPSCGSIYPNSF